VRWKPRDSLERLTDGQTQPSCYITFSAITPTHFSAVVLIIMPV
jgi:hypothetical protein